MLIGELGKRAVHRSELGFQFRKVAAMVARERSDDPGLAASRRKLDATAQKHGCGKSRQGQSLAKICIEGHPDSLRCFELI
jgi:hypothetical protein